MEMISGLLDPAIPRREIKTKDINRQTSLFAVLMLATAIRSENIRPLMFYFHGVSLSDVGIFDRYI